MKTALMVAEKPSLAQSLAKILSNGNCSSRKGFNGACSVHEWEGTFKGERVRFKMTSVCGHVMTLNFVGKYNNWDRVDPAELFICPTEKIEATPKLKMRQFLSQESRGSDYLILWLDCDKEGENICFEVIHAVQASMNRPRSNQQYIFRAKFSAITDRDIKAAMHNLGVPNENEARSVDARQELDLRIGCAFTRYQTKYFQGKYGNLDSNMISFGPCQTPTLGFCVERHDHIQSFKPEPYWVVQVTLKTDEGRTFSVEWDRVRCFDKDVAQTFLNAVKEETQARVTHVSKKEKAKQRPQALNTVELMRVASSGLGMGPHHAMQIAERLYTQGYISYPRTETTSYPENFDLTGTLKQQQKHPDWGDDVRDLLMNGIHKPRKGHDAGDHPPITPMRCATRSDLDGDNWRLYDYITRHFIATLSPDCIYLATVVSFSIGEEKFSMTGKLLLDPGYTKIMTWQALTREENVPDLVEGMALSIQEVKLAEKMTHPPDYLTEAELISLMEKHGIGTDASIPVHINNICQRNYVVVGSGRRLIPNPLGIVLVHGYQKIDHDLVLPTMRAAVENQLNLIAKAMAEFNAVKNHALDIFRLKFEYFVKQVQSMDQLFEVTFTSLAESGKAFSRCGKCRRYLKLIQAKPARLFCSTCDDTYSLPQNGNVRLYNELKCPLDDFELLTYTTGTKGKSFSFCPYCHNHPPFRDMRKGAGCNACTHPTCPHGLNSNGVSQCSDCESGVLVFDPSSRPKWKIACNRCDVVINMFEGATKVSVEDETCEDCGCQFVAVEYKPEKSKFPDGQSEQSGCIFCSATLSKLVQRHMSTREAPRQPRGGGRGGRGRRGGRRQPKDKMAQLAAYFV